MQKLRAEREGILNWMVDGCLLWQRERLGEPEAVRIATGEYQEEMDEIGLFIQECCILDTSGYLRVVSSILYKAYLEWCEKNSERPYAQRMFGIHLQNMGVKKDRTKSARYWTGIGMKGG
jgi:putative DNA primase/helicase